MANLRTNNIFGESGKDPNGSALFDTSGHLTAANASAFRVNQGSTEDFTIEAWIFLTATPDGANARIASIYHTAGNQRSYMFYVHTDDTLKFNYASSGTAGSVSTLAGGTVPHNEWVHVAVAHETSSTTLRIYKNGIEVATDNDPHSTYYANTSGDFTTGEDFTGFISNLHIVRGTCKYNTNFTPYREPIEEISDTTVLCCNSSVDVLSDDKSNTFTQSVDGAVEVSSFIPFDRADSGNVFEGPIKHNIQGYMYFPTGRTEERGRGRALLFVGYNPVAAGTVVSTVDFFSIQSQGNSTTFGSLSDTFTVGAAFASSTRGIYMGGSKPAVGNISNIDFFTIATTGNATDFGDVGTTFRYGAGLSNATRGIKAGGYQGGGSSGNLNIIEFVTIANTGNATDFADTSTPNHGLGGLASPTRGVLGGGQIYPAATNAIEFITIASQGVNAQDFGDLTEAKQLVAAGASNTRGIFGGGDNSGASKVINFITIASTGDAQDFGDLSVISEYAGMEMASNSSRMVFAGAGDYPAGSNTMEFINIATTGNASDFGDQTGDYGSSACSDSHGGLS